MATYESWNQAIADYFTAGAANGSSIFLSVDVEAIEEIAFCFLKESVADDPVHDFIEAVQHHCVTPPHISINIDKLKSPICEVPGGGGISLTTSFCCSPNA